MWRWLLLLCLILPRRPFGLASLTPRVLKLDGYRIPASSWTVGETLQSVGSQFACAVKAEERDEFYFYSYDKEQVTINIRISLPR